MRMLRRLHATAALLAGLSLAASIYGAQRIATALLVVVIIILVVSLEAQRPLASSSEKPS